MLIANLCFMLSLCDAVRQVPGTALVVSEPEGIAFSDRRAREIRTALHRIFKFAEHCQPASSAEMHQIARQRLCGDVQLGSYLMKHNPSDAQE